jgi:hypothetical protein
MSDDPPFSRDLKNTGLKLPPFRAMPKHEMAKIFVGLVRRDRQANLWKACVSGNVPRVRALIEVRGSNLVAQGSLVRFAGKWKRGGLCARVGGGRVVREEGEVE